MDFDMRVPVVFAPLDQAGEGDAVLFERVGTWPGGSAAFVPLPLHAPGCACCGARTAAGRALADLLHRRARREVAFFSRVIAVLESEAGRRDVEAALASDPVAATCFKLQGRSGA
jgi:hypothetical protein